MIFINRSISVQRKIAQGGIISALILVSLMACSWMPTGRLSLLAMGSFLISIAIIETDILNGLMVYGTTSILAFFLLPNRSIFLAHFIFFGLYGLVKCICEQISCKIIQWVLKFAYFNFSVLLLYKLASMFIQEEIVVKLHWMLLIVVAQFVFFIYDFVYTLFIAYYHQKWRKLWKNH